MSETQIQFVAGPKWALVTTVYFVVAIAVHVLTYPLFEITSLSSQVCVVVGVLITAIGICIYFAALAGLRTGLRTGTLVTSGLYAIVRHPLYAASILFIIPGIVLAFRSWVLLPMPAVAYVAFRIFIPGEEACLLDQYGQEYSLYRDRTNAIFPFPRHGR
jgi:protein-S-isoprenylcysteine O-methyltransferase Ste14